MAMRFRHLKKTSKEAVGVYRLVGLGGCPLGGQIGAMMRSCLVSVPLPPKFPVVCSALQISYPWTRPVL